MTDEISDPLGHLLEHCDRLGWRSWAEAVRSLRGERDRLRRERDAAYACIRRWWTWEPSTWDEGEPGKWLPLHGDDESEPMTPGEIEAIRQARSVPATETGETQKWLWGDAGDGNGMLPQERPTPGDTARTGEDSHG